MEVVLDQRMSDIRRWPGRWREVGAVTGRRLVTDLTPLRSSGGFRRLFIGQSASMVGAQVTLVAVPLQVFALTRSSLAVGFIGFAALVPLIVFGLYGGAIADAVDRRRLILVTSTGSAAVSVLLLVQALLHLDRLWLLYACVAVQAAFSAVDSPTRRALLPRLVGPAHIPAANTLFHGVFTLGIVVGPLVAGVLISTSGYAAAYAVDVGAFAVAISAIYQLPPLSPEGGGRRAGLSSVMEGLAFLRSRPVLLTVFLADVNAMVFGMPRALFPAMAAGQFHGGPQVAGYLYAAPAAGALLASLLSGWLPAVRRQGRAVLVAVAGWGAAITVFGLVRVLWLALVLLALAGAADAISVVFRSSILQLVTPDAMRGRLSGVNMIVGAGGPRLGDLEAGAVAAAFGPNVAVVSGGLACMAGVLLLALAAPAFARYDARPSLDATGPM
jgi:MFS family permease